MARKSNAMKILEERMESRISRLAVISETKNRLDVEAELLLKAQDSDGQLLDAMTSKKKPAKKEAAKGSEDSDDRH